MSVPKRSVPPLWLVAELSGLNSRMLTWLASVGVAVPASGEQVAVVVVISPRGADGVVRYPHLALSGGGANGAFGAGFLNGWSTTRSRPVFKIVTGVSTGALMAPFAFLGPAYDDALREFYTSTASRNIFRMLSIVPQLLAEIAEASSNWSLIRM
mgnify:CR=1 FL=1